MTTNFLEDMIKDKSVDETIVLGTYKSLDGKYAIENVPYLKSPTEVFNKGIISSNTMLKLMMLKGYMNKNGLHVIDFNYVIK